MKKQRFRTAMVNGFLTALLSGCGWTGGGDQVKTEASYRSLAQADERYAARDFAGALEIYNEAIKAGGIQADVLADAYLKRARCKTETGDLTGAVDDLALAEQGGVGGDEYAQAMKRLQEKKSRG
jgi:hypothetical protein